MDKEKIRSIALEMIDLSSEILEKKKSNITTDVIEMSLILLGEAKKLLLFEENYCFK